MDLGKLWSCFSLDDRLPGAYHQAKQWLRRSKGHLLTFSVKLSSNQQSPNLEKLLLKHTLRWHRIQVIASDENMVRRIMYGLSGAGDALKTFRVVSESGSVTENVQNLASCDFSCNSQMRSLSVHSLGNQSIKSITSTNLRMIQLFSSPTTVQDVYRFLTGCPELKHFSVDLIVPSEPFRHGGGMKAYTHSRLAYFGLGSTHTRSMITPGVEPTPYCDGLLESLRFPSLNSIKFCVPDSTTSILRSLSSLIENSFSNHPADSFSPLRRLIVFSFHESQRLLSNLNDEDWRTFAQALSLTPHLERLAIHAPVCEGFVKSLTIRGNPELAPNICPRLKGVDLCIDMCPELTLQEMLQSRSMAPMASAYPGLG